MIARNTLAFAVGLAGLVTLAACATLGNESIDGSESAIEGSARVGSIVTTTTRLRIRSSASKKNLKNLIGVLPTGTEVKILESEPSNGFYKVEIQDDELASSFRQRNGWCYGRYLLGGAEEEGLSETDGGAPDGGEEPTPEPDTDGGAAPDAGE